jgi:hypothetical protein
MWYTKCKCINIFVNKNMEGWFYGTYGFDEN